MTKRLKYLAWTFWLSLAATSGTMALFAGITLYLSPKLPEVETLRQVKLQTPLRIYSSDGLLIGEFGEKRRNPITIEQVPQAFIDAILAAEDDRFYSHPGVDIKGLLRAVSQLLQSGKIQTGGSTITMQVARNFFLTREQVFSRKFNEILLALQIEQELTKDEILELYTNKIYLGNRAYGIESAARVYYGKSINELSLAQLAMIAGLPKAPSAFNPIINPDRALIRRNWILGRMLHLGRIDASQHNDAVKEPVTAAYHGSRLELHAPYIAEMARKEAVDQLGLAAYTDGFRIYTTVNAKLQDRAQRAVIDGLLTYDLRHGYRGPEAQLDLPASTAQAAEDDEGQTLVTLTTQDLPLEQWQAALKNYNTIGGLTAAVVTQVNPDSIDALTSDGTSVHLRWQDGLSNARPYITENRRGPSPNRAADIVAVGDVIRVSQSDDGWSLTQIPAAQAALVALNPNNGAIQALVGGFDFSQSNFNRAIQAERQPGSNFKPFVYTAALENGMTPASIINDAPIVFDDASLEGTWRPENASGKFFGPTRLRQALYKSRNLVSIRILRSIGPNQAINGMARYGLDEDSLPHDLSLALGSYALTPLQVATGYTVFANGGYKVDPYLVDRIENVEGEIISQAMPATVCRPCELAEEKALQEDMNVDSDKNAAEPNPSDLAALESAMAAELALHMETQPNSTEAAPEDTDLSLAGQDSAANTDLKDSPALPRAPRVMSEQVAYLIDDMLRDVIQKGTGRKAKALGRTDLAGKTGTTNGPKDAWFSGYNSHIVATTWLGFDQNYALGRREYGGTSALPIWIDFMGTALDGVPEQPRALPDGLTSVRIDPETGKRARSDQNNGIFEIFRQENLPDYADEAEPILDRESSQTRTETLPEELF
ncbi:MAG: peptidase [Cellvibrionaceae bacterium]|nr:peptidase [Cellvibrionaceae bacterium]|tara:strand:- start:29439 stop:32096 length:2658 start_codon:yes stop_codon:yes gene_type:complete